MSGQGGAPRQPGDPEFTADPARPLSVPRLVTTTHDPRGGGRPRLIFSAGGRIFSHAPQREFDLVAGRTTIGSSDDCDLCLPGIQPVHAHIERDATDNYTYVQLGMGADSFVHGRPAFSSLLITGARIELGEWTLTYFRGEYADHGRPHGGRQGGEFAVQHHQSEPHPRDSTTGGGRDALRGDPGEYF